MANNNSNNLVPESEFRAVLQAMNQKLNEQQEHAPLFISLEKNLTNIVRVVPDEEYGTYTRSATKEDDDNSCSSASSSPSANEEQYDGDLLLDQVALQRAQELRQQVRDAAMRVSILQKETLDRAMELTRDEFPIIMEDDGLHPLMEQDMDDTVTTAITTDLTKTKKLLETTTDHLTPTLELLQETVQTIEDGLSVNHTNMSSIEQAIVSRDNEDGTVVILDEAMGEELNGEERLAHFLGQY